MTWLLVCAAVLALPAPLPMPATSGPDRHTAAADTDPALAWILALAGELRAGSDPLRALGVSAARHGVGHHAARAARLGADVPAALSRDARTHAVLARVAAAWLISQRTGAALADVLDNVADSHRRRVEVRQALEVEVAGPRATARLMSLLPLVGIGFAMMLGADPLRWFFSSWPALLCLLAGIALNLGGYLWLTRIVRGVERDL